MREQPKDIRESLLDGERCEIQHEVDLGYLATANGAGHYSVRLSPGDKVWLHDGSQLDVVQRINGERVRRTFHVDADHLSEMLRGRVETEQNVQNRRMRQLMKEEE